MSVGKICVREVDSAVRNDSVFVAAERMHSRKVGTLVVLDPEQVPIGIVTDRDLTVRVLAQALDPLLTTVGEVMTTIPKSVHEETPIEDALRLMRAGKFRRLPVVDREGHLVGLISLDDILDLITEELQEVRQLLHEESPSSLAAV